MKQLNCVHLIRVFLRFNKKINHSLVLCIEHKYVSHLRFADEVAIDNEILVEEYGQVKTGKVKVINSSAMQGKCKVYKI